MSMSNGDIEFIVGTICKEDPTIKFTPNGKAVCNFSVRTPGQKPNPKYGREKKDAAFVEVAAWEQLGENVAESFRQGDRVILQGLRSQREYTKQDGTVVHVETFTAWDAALSVSINCAEAVVNEHEGPEEVDVIVSIGTQTGLSDLS